MKSHIVGGIAGIATGLVIVGLAVFMRAESPFYDLYSAFAVGYFLLVPLLLVNLVLSVIYAWRKAPSVVFLWMWLPTLAALIGIEAFPPGIYTLGIARSISRIFKKSM